jgi:ribulose-5-phosphate 4-epimerase/fuculose-1-phosphate aldolase
MSEREGVIKYTLDFVNTKLDSQNLPSYLSDHHISQFMLQLNKARKLCVDNAMLGQDSNRYQGMGFGNISIRLKDATFLVSGTQTGHISLLKLSDCAWVTSVSHDSNHLAAQGEIKPSSESLTHGVIYQALPWVNAVIHVHCPHIWSHSSILDMPEINSDVPYGTAEMAMAVSKLCHHHFLSAPETLINAYAFVMKGHEDGVVAFARKAEDAALLLAQLKAQSQVISL